MHQLRLEDLEVHKLVAEEVMIDEVGLEVVVKADDVHEEEDVKNDHVKSSTKRLLVSDELLV
jgi:hypothetical protein